MQFVTDSKGASLPKRSFVHAAVIAVVGLCSTASAQCGIYDDGASEFAMGIVVGGELGWLHRQECLVTIDRVEAAFGTSSASSPSNGNHAWIAVYEDLDCNLDPRNALLLQYSLSTVVVNSGTNVLNHYPTGQVPIASGCSFVMATADHDPGQFPAPVDAHGLVPYAWVVGSTLRSTLNITDLNANNIPLQPSNALATPGPFLLRAHGDESPGDFATTCYGGVHGACACGNQGAPDEGCANSSGAGARIAGYGTASLSADTLVVITTQLPDSPGLTFQGENSLDPAPTFGDGLRCCGTNIVRWATVAAQGGCAATDGSCGILLGGFSGPISQHPSNAGLQAGSTRCYQHWYRDPGPNNPCGVLFFNLSSALLVTWSA